MPEGERSWADSKGPRRTTTVRLSAQTHALLEVAASDVGLTRTSLATELLERWAQEWLRLNSRDVRDRVHAERQRREEHV